MTKFTQEFIKAMLIRALWTMAQTGLSMISIGAAISDINWGHTVSVMLVAGLYSILKSIAVGVPEAYRDGTLVVDLSDPDKDTLRMEYDKPIGELVGQDKVTFRVEKK